MMVDAFTTTKFPKAMPHKTKLPKIKFKSRRIDKSEILAPNITDINKGYNFEDKLSRLKMKLMLESNDAYQNRF